MKNNCVLCNAQLGEPIYDTYDNRFGIKGTFIFKTCHSCGHIQLDPIPEDLVLLEYYQLYYNTVEKRMNNYLKYRKIINMATLGKIYNYFEGDISFNLKKGNGRLLEIGCNEGKNLACYSKNGFETYGLETNIEAVKKAKELGFQVFDTEINNLSNSEQFDVIVIPNVLEHIVNPIDFLCKVKKHLNKKGELWISLPNKNSIFKRIFGSNWINWHPPFHISQFSKNNLEKIIHSTGLSIDYIRFVTPTQWIAMSIISTIFYKPELPTKMMRNPLLLIGLMLSIKLILFLPLYIINSVQKGDCIKLIAVNE